MELYVNTTEELKKVENFLFRFTYPEEFSLCIKVIETGETFNYKTNYNKFAKGLVLETF